MDRVTPSPSDFALPEPPPHGSHYAAVVCAGLIGGCMLACLAILAVKLGILRVAPRTAVAQVHTAAVAEPQGDLLSRLQLFKGWSNPDVALVLSGEMHGYLQPCGCTAPQFGGLARRYNFIQSLRQRAWPIVAVDLGDLNQTTARQEDSKPTFDKGPEAILKYTYAMKALDLMGYTAVNFGENEMSMPLSECLAHYALNNPTPRVLSANLLGRQSGQPFNGMVFDIDMADKQPGPKVGVVGLTGFSVEQKVKGKDPHVQFAQNSAIILLDALRALKANKAELVVLLYQGSNQEAHACAKFCAGKRKQDPTLPRLDVILCVSNFSEPPAVAQSVEDSMIVEVGWKGRFVGVVGAFRQKKGPAPFELKYQLVSISPELETPKGQEAGTKMMALMEDYTAEVKRDNYLTKYKQTNHPVQVAFKDAAYVGSEKCMTCHEAAYKVWEKSKHAHAYKTLVDAKHPSLRQFDGECVVCHTVGFGKKTGFESLEKTKFLTDVGCESCHGPGSEHVRKPHVPAMLQAINPLKLRGAAAANPAAKHKQTLDLGDFCMKCHDLDNDNHFDFDKYWPQIVHKNLK